jgi:hypothetical protein
VNRPIHLKPFVSSGEVFLVPGEATPIIVPMQLFQTSGGAVVLRIGDTTYWFDANGKYDGPEMNVRAVPTPEKIAEIAQLLDDCVPNKGQAPATSYFGPGCPGYDAEVAGWPRKLDS